MTVSSCEVYGHPLILNGYGDLQPQLVVQGRIVIAVAVEVDLRRIGPIRDAADGRPRHPLSLIEDLLERSLRDTEAVFFEDRCQAPAPRSHSGNHRPDVSEHRIGHTRVGPDQAEDVFIRLAFQHEFYRRETESLLEDLSSIAVPPSGVDPSHIDRVPPEGSPAAKLALKESRAEYDDIGTVRAASVVRVVAEDDIPGL